MLMARREGVICLYSAVLGVLSQTVCRAPGITRQGKASLASFGGGHGGEELKGNVGLTFLISQLRPPPPTPSPGDVSSLSPGCLHLRGRCLACSFGGRGAATPHLLQGDGGSKVPELLLQLPPVRLRGALPPRPGSF